MDVSYQFTAKTQPPSSWPDAYATSYTLGYKFGRAFGKTSGAGTVTSFEAGNEPCECLSAGINASADAAHRPNGMLAQPSFLQLTHAVRRPAREA